MRSRPDLINRTWKTAIAFLVAVVGIYLMKEGHLRFGETIEHLSLLVAAMLGVHLLERAFLWQEISEWNRSSLRTVFEDANKLLQSAASTGLEHIEPDRSHTTDTVLTAIDEAQKRVWLLGVSFSEQVILFDALRRFERRSKNLQPQTIDLRILLLDCLSTAAVLRALLETEKEKFEPILDGSEIGAYFKLPIYSNFAFNLNTLSQNAAIYGSKARFYRSSPPCWLVIVDDVAFFEPYAFTSSDSPGIAEPCPGAIMPVLVVRQKEYGEWFRILERHFTTVWKTSNLDVHGMAEKEARKEKHLQEILERQQDWFRHVWTEIHNPSDGH